MSMSVRFNSTWPLAVPFLVYSAISIIVNRLVNVPYMDEKFHVPQAQRYCEGHFLEWDPMITTFPGLYVASLPFVALTAPFNFLASSHTLHFSSLCSLPILRSFNVAAAILSLILTWKLVHASPLQGNHREGTSSLVAAIKSATLALYPLHFFFTFLYYTDTVSTASVLAMYYSQLKGRYLACAMCAAISILFRQTNAVWAVFFLGLSVIDLLPPVLHGQPESTQPVPGVQKSVPHASPSSQSSLRQRSRRTLPSAENPTEEMTANPDVSIFQEVWSLLVRAWISRRQLLTKLWPLMAVILSFLSFVIANGGVVVGAKEDHKMALHLVQPLYFFATCTLAHFPILLPHVTATVMAVVQSLRIHPVATTASLTLAIGTVAFLVHNFSVAHPYLLADNRHYTFYIWKDIINRNRAARYCLAPFYLLSIATILRTLRLTKSRPWLLLFVGCTTLVLVPSPLLELRYFTVPVLIVGLNVEHGSVSRQAWTLCLYAGVNAATLFMFLYHTFQWTNSNELQRFMW